MRVPDWSPEEWSAVVTAGATVATFVVAIWAAFYAGAQVRHARELRDEQAKPFVVVDFEPSEAWGNVINLVVENVGQTLARDVRLEFDPPLTSSQEQKREHFDFRSSHLLTHGIPSMPPRRRFEAFFDLSHERDKRDDLPMSYRVTVRCADAKGVEQEPLEYVLDLNFRYGLRHIGLRSQHHTASALEAIRDVLRRWTVRQGVRVWNRDFDAKLAEEQEEMEAEWAEFDAAQAAAHPKVTDQDLTTDFAPQLPPEPPARHGSADEVTAEVEAPAQVSAGDPQTDGGAGVDSSENGVANLPPAPDPASSPQDEAAERRGPRPEDGGDDRLSAEDDGLDANPEASR